ncbi:MAG TPA: phage Gp37/Gp68 family protein [Devosiaceae bacterium]|nr:phage Gp37/Gp68 family protein [Devosiaceae bacterium]
MADNTGIEWTDATWNPLRGCSRVSEGCRHCYAEGVAARFSGLGQPYEGLARFVVTKTAAAGKTTQLPPRREARWTGKIAFAGEAVLTQPLRWKRPRKIFVNSMSDLFHESVPDEWIDRIFAVMALCPQHTFQVLTKRPERMRAYMLERWQPAPAQRFEFGGDVFDVPAETVGEGRRDQVERECEGFIREFKLDDTERAELWDEQDRLKIMQWAWPLPNVWLGTSVEDQVTADTRIPYLLQTPAAVRFISAEPLLGQLNLSAFVAPAMHINGNPSPEGLASIVAMAKAAAIAHGGVFLDWVIVGGESGPGARPMHPDWARELRDQCAAAGVAFLFKQWGEWAPGECASRAPARTEQAASYYDDGWSFETVTVRMSQEMHRDDEPDVWRLGKKQAGRTLDGVEHNGFPEVRA